MRCKYCNLGGGSLKAIDLWYASFQNLKEELASDWPMRCKYCNLGGGSLKAIDLWYASFQNLKEELASDWPMRCKYSNQVGGVKRFLSNVWWFHLFSLKNDRWDLGISTRWEELRFCILVYYFDALLETNLLPANAEVNVVGKCWTRKR